MVADALPALVSHSSAYGSSSRVTTAFCNERPAVCRADHGLDLRIDNWSLEPIGIGSTAAVTSLPAIALDLPVRCGYEFEPAPMRAMNRLTSHCRRFTGRHPPTKRLAGLARVVSSSRGCRRS